MDSSPSLGRACNLVEEISLDHEGEKGPLLTDFTQVLQQSSSRA